MLNWLTELRIPGRSNSYKSNLVKVARSPKFCSSPTDIFIFQKVEEESKKLVLLDPTNKEGQIEEVKVAG